MSLLFKKDESFTAVNNSSLAAIKPNQRSVELRNCNNSIWGFWSGEKALLQHFLHPIVLNASKVHLDRTKKKKICSLMFPDLLVCV